MRRSACVAIAVFCALAANAAGARPSTFANENFAGKNQAIVGDQEATEDANPPSAEQRNGGGLLANHLEESVAADSHDQQVKQRLQVYLTRELIEHFDLFVYVSKASEGPWAQRMYVFQKQPDESLYPLYDWPVSTGRESTEPNPAGTEVPTSTPAGFYELDPERFYSQYRSTQWQEPMPYTMFLKWVDHGVQTGLAIHGASDEAVAQLGARASAGCIRLAPDNAKTLFTLIHDSYKGDIPEMAYDQTSQTILNNGMLMRDEDGDLKFAPGYRALVVIDEYGGGRAIETALN
jgi:hypothetical protein